MRRLALSLAIVGLAVAPAAAQPAKDSDIERVIVTAPKLHSGVTPNAIAHDFVKSFAMPSVLTEQISRWETGICPFVYGLAPKYADVMEERLRAIVKQAGAPLKDKGCRRNLTIIFTPQPQGFLDALHAKNSDVLGYHGSAIVTHMIQAWYVTGTVDVRGQGALDRDTFFAIDDCGGGCPPHASSGSNTPFMNVGGWRARAEVSNDLFYVTIIVDLAKTAQYNLASVTDYIAMLALSRAEDYDDCQLMPSITNLLSPNCDDRLKPDQITPTDIAYLRGVYKMDPGAKLLIQQDQIASEMAKAIAVKAEP